MLESPETRQLMDEKSVPVRISFVTEKGSPVRHVADLLGAEFDEDMEVTRKTQKIIPEGRKVSFVVRLKADVTDPALIMHRVDEALLSLGGRPMWNFKVELLLGGKKSVMIDA